MIRAHLVPIVAESREAGLMAPGIAYLTSDVALDDPFAARYRIVESAPFSLKQLQQRLRILGARLTAVKKRGVPIEPEKVMAATSPCGDRQLVLVLYPHRGRVHGLLCERPEAPAVLQKTGEAQSYGPSL